MPQQQGLELLAGQDHGTRLRLVDLKQDQVVQEDLAWAGPVADGRLQHGRQGIGQVVLQPAKDLLGRDSVLASPPDRCGGDFPAVAIRVGKLAQPGQRHGIGSCLHTDPAILLDSPDRPSDRSMIQERMALVMACRRPGQEQELVAEGPALRKLLRRSPVPWGKGPDQDIGAQDQGLAFLAPFRQRLVHIGRQAGLAVFQQERRISSTFRPDSSAW